MIIETKTITYQCDLCGTHFTLPEKEEPMGMKLYDTRNPAACEDCCSKGDAPILHYQHLCPGPVGCYEILLSNLRKREEAYKKKEKINERDTRRSTKK